MLRNWEFKDFSEFAKFNFSIAALFISLGLGIKFMQSGNVSIQTAHASLTIAGEAQKLHTAKEQLKEKIDQVAVREAEADKLIEDFKLIASQNAQLRERLASIDRKKSSPVNPNLEDIRETVEETGEAIQSSVAELLPTAEKLTE